MDINNLKRQTNILAVIGKATTLRRKGREWWGLCPLHAEQTPSLGVSQEKGTWHCFGCGKGGDVISFVREWQGLSFAGAVAWLGGGPELPHRQNSAEKDWRARLAGALPFKDSPAEAYLRGRGIAPCFPAFSRVAYHPTWYGKGPAVIFPIVDAEGRQVAAEGRFLQPAPGSPKVLSAGPKRAGVFATLAAFDQPHLVIVESPINALSFFACAVPAIATCGAAHFPDWLPAQCTGKTIWTAFDPDPAGNAGARHLAEALHPIPCRLRTLHPPEDNLDWNDCLCRYDKNELQEVLREIMG